MAEARGSDASRLRPRRWTFAACIFDEANWALTVGGQRVSVETKPLELLRELLVRAGNVVSKDELLDAIWPDVTVVEASLPTAVYKLRAALGDDGGERCIIETVPGVGYRLAVPVALEHLPPAAGEAILVTAPEAALQHEAAGGQGSRKGLRLFSMAGGLAIAFVTMAFALTSSQQIQATKVTPSFSKQEVVNSLRRLDVGRIEEMLAAGWDPNTLLNREGTTPVTFVLEMCEWDRGHDQRKLMLVVRTLFDGGGRIDHRNVWGDTPYSIAKAPRYCGPNHPVTDMLRRLCFNGYRPFGDRCLASYEIARRTGR